MTDCEDEPIVKRGKQKGWTSSKPKFEVIVRHPTEEGIIMFSKQYASLSSINKDFKDIGLMSLSNYTNGKKSPPPLFEFKKICKS